MTKILLAEDDPNLGELLAEYLDAKGFEVVHTKNGEEALQAFFSQEFSICVLDVMMPKKDGFALAKEIREKNNEVPIVFLTAKSLSEDTIKGFEIGADDYVTKPFVMEELLMRIKAILKRAKTSDFEAERTVFSIGKFLLDTQKRTLTLGEEVITLTTKEAALLKLFSQNANQPVSRSVALKLIWGDDSYFNARSMDVYITKLRKHLKADESLKILNLHGEGFTLVTN